MCGRYSFAPDLKIVNEHYDITVGDGQPSTNYNCAPTQMLPVVTGETPVTLSIFRWGLIPFWAKDASIGSKLINARAETITEKASFKHAFVRRRCLVPADAFYEWKKMESGKLKIPYRIFLKDVPLFSMAGLWDQWKSPDGQIVRTFTILTTTPNELMAEIHDRMPVILTKEDEKLWLKSADQAQLQELLKPFPAAGMDVYRISELVNSPKNNTEAVARPVLV